MLFYMSNPFNNKPFRNLNGNRKHFLKKKLGDKYFEGIVKFPIDELRMS